MYDVPMTRAGSAARLRVVLLAMDAFALPVLAALNARLFEAVHVAVAAGDRFLAIHARLTGFAASRSSNRTADSTRYRRWRGRVSSVFD